MLDAAGSPLAVNDLPVRMADVPSGDGFGALLATPIRSGAVTHCVLNFFRPRGHDFMSGDVKLMEALAQQAAIMIENAELYRDLEALFLNTLKMLVQMIEARDEYTRGHSERVLAYAKAVGGAYGLSERELEDLGWSALLHDFGKIRVPDAIIKKPARLDPEEWTVMKRHPKDGADLLRPIAQLRGAIPGVELHHERWDGRGYPHGLREGQIPLQARIVSIVDAYDALTSNRAYRSPMSHREAVEELARNAGTQFDPETVALIQREFPEGFLPAEDVALPKAA
ncbi:MAG: HD domain-containing protein, partial [Candidatus Methylomirabilis sp.]|nr:HD domain-containing protein [Deltaproteobacteria bacterium]